MSSAQDGGVLISEEELFSSVIPPEHAYRKLKRLVNFELFAQKLQEKYSHLGQHGIPAVSGLKAMLLQFWEDYSDREMEKAVRENLAIRWFVGFSLNEKTPDHSYFGKFRKRIGTKYLADMFNFINSQLQKEGYSLVETEYQMLVPLSQLVSTSDPIKFKGIIDAVLKKGEETSIWL